MKLGELWPILLGKRTYRFAGISGASTTHWPGTKSWDLTRVPTRSSPELPGLLHLNFAVPKMSSVTEVSLFEHFLGGHEDRLVIWAGYQSFAAQGMFSVKVALPVPLVPKTVNWTSPQNPSKKPSYSPEPSPSPFTADQWNLLFA